MILELNNIVKTYEQKTVFDQFDLQVNKGEFLGIVGPSGSGKSTLLSIIATLDLPDSGEVVFEGENLLKFSSEEVASIRNEKFGFIFQHSNMLMHLNVKENIALPFYYGKNFPEVSVDTIVKNSLVRVGLEHYENKEVRYLSGGEQQRVAIARALVMDPQIIFADEPTGNLDEANSIQILDMLKELVEKEGKTVVIVTHDPLVITYCSRIIEIEKL